MGTVTAGIYVTLLLASSLALPSKRTRSDTVITPYNFVAEGTNELATAILQGYVDTDSNLAFSPLGYSALLAILAEGARGGTREQLTNALHLPQDAQVRRTAYKNVLQQLKEKNLPNQPEFKNWFYIYKNFSVESEFRSILQEYYLTEVKDVDRLDSEETKNEKEEPESTTAKVVELEATGNLMPINQEKADDLMETEKMQDSKESEKVQDSKSCEEMEDSKSPEKLEDSKSSEKLEDSKSSETIEDSKSSEKVEDSKSSETMEDSKSSETMEDSKSSETMEESKSPEKLEDSKSPEKIDDSKTPEKMEDSMTPEKIDSSTKPDYSDESLPSEKVEDKIPENVKESEESMQLSDVESQSKEKETEESRQYGVPLYFDYPLPMKTNGMLRKIHEDRESGEVMTMQQAMMGNKKEENNRDEMKDKEEKIKEEMKEEKKDEIKGEMDDKKTKDEEKSEKIEKIKEDLRETVKKVMKEDMKEAMKDAMEDAMKDDKTEPMKVEMTADKNEEIKEDKKEEMKDEIKEDNKEITKDEMNEKTKEDKRETMKDDKEGEKELMKDDENKKDTMKDEMKEDKKEIMSDEMTEDKKETMKDEMKEDKTESMKDELDNKKEVMKEDPKEEKETIKDEEKINMPNEDKKECNKEDTIKEESMGDNKKDDDMMAGVMMEEAMKVDPMKEEAMISQAMQEEKEIMLAMGRSARSLDLPRLSRGVLKPNDVTSSLSGNNIVVKSTKSNKISQILAFNGMYYKGTWAVPFTRQKIDSFYKSDTEKSTATMMGTRGSFRIGNVPDLDSVAIELPYKGGRYSLLVVMPNSRTGLRQLIADLTGYPLRNIQKNLEPQEVEVCLPSFEIETTTKPIEALSKFGVSDIFNQDAADLSGISKDSGLFVEEVAQVVTVRVDEGSGEYNFFTASNPSTRTGMSKFVADHPFLYFVRDTLDNLIVVAGKVVDPSVIPDR